MEEKEMIPNYPYFETTYLDDNNDKHLVYVTNNNDLKFYEERFTILSIELKKE